MIIECLPIMQHFNGGYLILSYIFETIVLVMDFKKKSSLNKYVYVINNKNDYSSRYYFS